MADGILFVLWMMFALPTRCGAEGGQPEPEYLPFR
jgi:hypothetical protein